MELVDLDAINYHGHNILIFGAPGTGKTRFIGTMALKLYTLLLDVDDGSETIKYMPVEVKQNIVVVKMTKFTDLDQIYKLMTKNDPKLWSEHLTKANGGKVVVIDKPFEAVAIDTWSELQYEMVDEIRPGDSMLAMQDIKKMQALQIQDWGKVMDLTKLAIKCFKELPVTFVASFHEQLLKDDLSGGVFGLPSLQGKVAYDIGKYFDIMGHMTMTQDGKYAIATKGHARWQAKSRIPCASMIVDPTFEKLFASVEENLKKGNIVPAGTSVPVINPVVKR